MPRLDENTVRHVAHLARIAVTDEEVRLYSEQLSKILDYVDQLNELDTANVPATEHPLAASDVVRPDIIQSSWPPDLALENAPYRHGDYFLVPKVLDQEDA